MNDPNFHVSYNPTQQQQQQQYNQGFTPNFRQPEQPMSVGDWMITMLITVIPIVGLVMLFVWAFGSEAPETKKNWAKASLIWMAIGIVLWVLVFGALFASLMSMGSSFSN